MPLTAYDIFIYIKPYVGNCEQMEVIAGLEEFLQNNVIVRHLTTREIIRQSQHLYDMNPPLNEDEAIEVIKELNKLNTRYPELSLSKPIWDVYNKRRENKDDNS